MKQTALTLCGALAGGIVGYFAFSWLASHGFYALALPGGSLGLGAGIGKTRNVFVSIICGLAATMLGFFTEWRFAPFSKDESLRYFITHAYQLTPVTLVLILVGGLIGFWIPFRRRTSSPRLGPSGSNSQMG